MAALTAANVTVVVQLQKRSIKTRNNLCKITFGDSALTYPAGGVPLPSDLSFGMKKALDYLIVVDPDDASGIQWRYDRENKKLRGWLSSGSGTAALANSTTITGATAVTANAATAGLTPGTFVEMTTTLAPAAQTIYAEAVGQ